MAPQPHPAVSKADAKTTEVVRRASAARWPKFWPLLVAILISLMLWAGVFYTVDVIGDFFAGLEPAR